MPQHELETLKLRDLGENEYYECFACGKKLFSDYDGYECVGCHNVFCNDCWDVDRDYPHDCFCDHCPSCTIDIKAQIKSDQQDYDYWRCYK